LERTFKPTYLPLVSELSTRSRTNKFNPEILRWKIDHNVFESKLAAADGRAQVERDRQDSVNACIEHPRVRGCKKTLAEDAAIRKQRKEQEEIAAKQSKERWDKAVAAAKLEAEQNEKAAAEKEEEERERKEAARERGREWRETIAAKEKAKKEQRERAAAKKKERKEQREKDAAAEKKQEEEKGSDGAEPPAS
jgi:hypothetical protein